MKHINKLYKPLIQSIDCDNSQNPIFNSEFNSGNIVGMKQLNQSPQYSTLKKVQSSERNAFYVHSAKKKLPQPLTSHLMNDKSILTNDSTKIDLFKNFDTTEQMNSQERNSKMRYTEDSVQQES